MYNTIKETDSDKAITAEKTAIVYRQMLPGLLVKNYLIRKHYLIAIDGNQKFYRNYQWDEKCLKRHVGREVRTPGHFNSLN